MPIAAYLETGVRRLEQNEKIGLYAIVLPKSKCFGMGQASRPYGLDEHNNARARKANGNVFLMKLLFL